MDPERPGPASQEVLHRFRRGKQRPRGVVWFGASSFWGHLRHLIASAIATENIDSRDWMTPDDPQDLVSRIAAVLGGDPRAANLTAALGRDVYVDFVADTGDDVAVSGAVARLLFAAYQVPDPDRPGESLLAPRGDILLFGGDTAYPVATAKEILDRVIAPWNQVLRALAPDGRRRVLLGVPGNHDWYDGLDGFCRMFRRGGAAPAPSSRGVAAPQSSIEHHVKWARELVRGGTLAKPGALALEGYTPVQSATYFSLSLAPRLELLAADRQLTTIDSRQAAFLDDRHRAHLDAATLVVLPDPVFPFGVPSRSGAQMVQNLRLGLESRETFILSGDIHHYERFERDRTLHVTAGGGGAFLHPVRIAGGGLTPEVSWPAVAQCRRLLRQVPWKLARGRSGFLPHLGLLSLFALALLLTGQLLAHTGLVVSASVVTFLLVGSIYALIGGVTRNRAVLPLALGAALVTSLIPVGGSLLVHELLRRLGWSPSAGVAGFAALVVAVFAGTFVFGGYLALLTLFGLENMQAFTVLDHPGFKHFVRLRVRADGSGIDGWCVGLADPLGEDQKPVLVDRFTWRPFQERR